MKASELPNSCLTSRHDKEQSGAAARKSLLAYADEQKLDKEHPMLGNNEAMATIAVRDLAKAHEFYGGTLGLQENAREGEEAITYLSGSSQIIVYRSQYAGSNKATSATWAVGEEIEEIVAALKTKGVSFEHYSLPGLQLAGDIHVADTMKVAWFRDPDGNILSINGN
jgi:catechol 2,3-dioxygenase-like lactoylglutathione lyase family enzyme